MAGDFREKLEFILSGNATGAIKAFQETGAAAEETGAKTAVAGKKTAASSKSAGTSVGVMGALVVGALFEASKSWEEAALSAGKLSDATGLTVQQASQWSVVAGDADVDTKSLEKSLGFMNKTAGNSPEKFEKLGVSLQDANGQALSTNDLFLKVVDTLDALKNPQEKAAAAAKLLGRGWQSMSELISEGSKKLAADLGKVPKSLVFDSSNVADAKEYRDTLKEVQDRVKGVALEIGKAVVPAFKGFATVLAEVIKLKDVLTNTSTELGRFGTVAEAVINPLGKYGDVLKIVDGSATGVAGALGEIRDAQGHLINSTEAAADSERNTSDATLELWRAGVRLADSTVTSTEIQRRFNAAIAESKGVLGDAKDGYHPVITVAQELAAAIKQATQVVGDAKDGYHKAATAGGELATALGDVQRAQAETKADVAGLNTELGKQISALQTLQGVAESSIDKEHAFEGANIDAVAAIADYTATLKNHKSTQTEVATAAYNTGETIRGASKAYSDSKGDVEGSTAAIQDQIAYIENIADHLKPGSPLRVRLEGYVAELKSVPTSVPTTITLTVGDTIEKLRDIQRMLNTINATKVANQLPSPQTTTPAHGLAAGGRGGSDRGIAAADAGTQTVEQATAAWEKANAAVASNATATDDAAKQAAAHALEIADNKSRYDFEQGKISLAQRIAYLQTENDADEAYSSSWISRQSEMQSIADAARRKQQEDDDAAARKKQDDADAAAAHAKELADNEEQYLFEHNQLSLADYESYLAAKLAGTEQYSNSWKTLRDQMDALQKSADDAAAAKATQDANDAAARIDKIVTKAKLAVALLDAQAKEVQAQTDENQANADAAAAQAASDWVNTLPKATQEQRDEWAKKAAEAKAKAEAARKTHIDALIAGADAQANALGYADDSPEWNASVRQSIADYEVGHPQYAAELNAYLAGLPKFHGGGVVPGHGEVPIMAWGGEVVSKGGDGMNFYTVIHANGLDEAQAGALVRREMSTLAATIKAGRR